MANDLLVVPQPYAEKDIIVIDSVEHITTFVETIYSKRLRKDKRLFYPPSTHILKPKASYGAISISEKDIDFSLSMILHPRKYGLHTGRGSYKTEEKKQHNKIKQAVYMLRQARVTNKLAMELTGFDNMTDKEMLFLLVKNNAGRFIMQEAYEDAIITHQARLPFKINYKRIRASVISFIKQQRKFNGTYRLMKFKYDTDKELKISKHKFLKILNFCVMKTGNCSPDDFYSMWAKKLLENSDYNHAKLIEGNKVRR